MEMTELTTLDSLQDVLERSHQRPQLLFKHSLTCPVSHAAHKAMKSYLDGEPSTQVDYWLIAVQTSRPVSDAIAAKLEVRHESPQALLVTDGKAVWNDSHFRITRSALTEAVPGSGA